MAVSTSTPMTMARRRMPAPVRRTHGKVRRVPGVNDERMSFDASRARVAAMAGAEGEGLAEFPSSSEQGAEVLRIITHAFDSEGVEMSEGEAEGIAMRAFGWTLPKKYWKGAREREMPDAAHVEASIAFLKDEVGLSGHDFAKAVRSFPEVWTPHKHVT